MQHLTKDELKALLRAARYPESGRYGTEERNWLMILVAFWHGLRASEVVSLTGGQFKDGYLTVARLKGSLKTTQPLMESNEFLLNEKAPLEKLAAEVGDNGRLFPISRVMFWKIVQRCCNEAGIPAHKAHPHVLKHTCAMLTIEKAGIENVRQYLGHKSIASTGAYLKVDDEKASKAIASAIGG